MNPTTITKNLRQLGEAEYTKIVTRYAKSLYPTLTREAAFAKVFTAADAEGAAIRTAHAISKGYGDVGDDAEPGDDDALDGLNAKAAELKKINPKLSKEQAFAKIYVDPENAELAKRERERNGF